MAIFLLWYDWFWWHRFVLLHASFHTSVSWWLFSGVWMTVSLFNSPGLFSVFWLILVMLWFGWSPLVLQFPTLPAPLSSLGRSFQACYILLGSPLLTGSRAFSLVLLQGRITCHSFCFPSVLLFGQSKRKSPQFSRFSFYLYKLSQDLLFWLGEDLPMKSERQRVSSSFLDFVKYSDFNNSVVGIVSILFLISASLSRFLVAVPTATLTAGITVTFLCHCFLCPSARSNYLSIFLL